MDVKALILKYGYQAASYLYNKFRDWFDDKKLFADKEKAFEEALKKENLPEEELRAAHKDFLK
mgnify:CR=1 FL=1